MNLKGWIKATGIVAVALMSKSALAAQTQPLVVNLSGVKGEAATNIQAYLHTIEIPDDSRAISFSSVIHNNVVDALKAYGYYSPTIDMDFPHRRQVDLKVQPGKRTHIKELYVRIEGDAQNDPKIKALLEKSPLLKEKGKPLSHYDYEYFKKQLDTLALSRGYFDASYPVHRMEIRPWEQRADIYLVYDSGHRYHFGDVSYEGSQIQERKLTAITPFKQGDAYSADALAELNSRLSQTGWFRSVSVRPQLAQTSNTAEGNDGAGGSGLMGPSAVVRPSPDDSTEQPAPRQASQAVAPVDVQLLPADRHHFDVGVGYETDVGPHMQFSWLQPWVNSRGDSWTNRLYLSGPKETLAGQYRIPLANPLNDAYEFNYGFEYLDDNDTRSRKTYVAPTRVWHFTNGWNQRLYVRVSQEDFTQASDSANVFLVTPGISWDRTAVDNEQFPMHGNRQDFLIEGTSRKLGSDISFLRAEATTRWIESLGNNNRFYMRGNIGATATNDFHRMPASLRFFAGGDSSVRGYSYESLAPRDRHHDLLGGRDMVSGTAEYQYRLSGNWWGATFYDVGNAFDDWSDMSLQRAAGVGIRWISPVGPIRLDLAHPFNGDHSPWRIHFAIGPEF